MKKTTSRKAARRPAKQTDLYHQITDCIVVALENGVAPWRKPWRAAAGSGLAGLPLNATTGRHYSGVNVLLLWMSAEEQGFRNNRWLTYRQAQQAGGQVRKGEKATLAVVYKDWTKQAEDREGNRLYDSDGKPLTETVPMLKPLQLFNAEQCEGLPAEVAASPEQPPAVDEDGILSPDVMDRVVRMFNATGVKHRTLPQNRAYYRPLTDEIVMPVAGQFFTEADWWSTLLHELVHSTGHVKRLNREGMAHVVNGLSDAPGDFLGRVFMQLGDTEALFRDKPFITMSEPACGAGCMVLAFADVLQKAGWPPHRYLWVSATDIDPLAAGMAYIQLSLCGIAGEVVVGNTLANERRRILHTPGHYLGGWPVRLDPRHFQAA
ncbi:MULTISPECIES: ArdC-like ssDNA-binding domain-containing protein [Erwiniaceae]|nr:ArdC-like ssDNA-binding domain-containing protein [Pantoea agglomerans]